MAALSESRAALLRELVHGAPDHALLSLKAALASCLQDQGPMAQVQALVAAETADRQVRDVVFAPLLPLFSPQARAGGLRGLPPAVLRMMWAGLKALAPDEVKTAAAPNTLEEDQAAAIRTVLDRLCLMAAAELRAGSKPEFRACAGLLRGHSADGLERLCSYLDLCPTARGALGRLPEWLGRHTEERVASARLAYRDAVSFSDDGGPNLIEMLAAHLDEPWQAARLVSIVMSRPGDAFAASSELRAFGERLLDEVDRRLAAVIGFQPGKGRDAGAAAARQVQAATVCLAEMEQAFELSPAGPWGGRVAQQKRTLSGLVEPRIRLTEEAVAAALPLQAGRVGHRVRPHPRLDRTLDLPKVTRAQALAAFTAGVRTAAASGGFSALRADVAERLEGRLQQYVEDVLEVLHAAPAEDVRVSASAHLEAAADLLETLIDGSAGKVVRRRAAAA